METFYTVCSTLVIASGTTAIVAFCILVVGSCFVVLSTLWKARHTVCNQMNDILDDKQCHTDFTQLFSQSSKVVFVSSVWEEAGFNMKTWYTDNVDPELIGWGVDTENMKASTYWSPRQTPVYNKIYTNME